MQVRFLDNVRFPGANGSEPHPLEGVDILIEFYDFSEKEDGFEFQVSEDGINWGKTIILNPAEGEVGDNGILVTYLLENEPYNSQRYYRVRAFTGELGSGSEKYSTWDEFGPFYTPPHIGPNNVNVELNEDGIPLISFDTPSPFPINGGVRIFRKTEAEEYSVIADVNFSPFVDLSAEQGTTFFYKVAYYNENEGGNDSLSPFSNEVVITTPVESNPPSLINAVIDVTGEILTLTFNENVKIGNGGSGGFVSEGPAGSIAYTYISGDETNILTFSPSRTIQYSEYQFLSYLQPGDGIMDMAGNELESFEDLEIVNNSLHGLIVNQGFESPSGVNGGYDNGETWMGGSVNPNYTTKVLEGNESLRISSNNAAIYTDWVNNTPSHEAVSECWLEFLIMLEEVPSSISTLCALRNSDDSPQIALRANGENVYLYTNGNDSSASSFKIEKDKTYKCVLHYKSGDTCSLQLCEPGNPLPTSDGESGVFLTKISAPSQTVQRVRPSRGLGPGGYIYDRIRVSKFKIYR